jgi:hypothetical protein
LIGNRDDMNDLGSVEFSEIIIHAGTLETLNL